MSDDYTITELRVKCYNRFWNWRGEGKWMHPSAFKPYRKGSDTYITTLEHFNMLLGRPDTFEDEIFTDEQITIIRGLLGPHGYTYYKMLLVRRDHD